MKRMSFSCCYLIFFQSHILFALQSSVLIFEHYILLLLHSKCPSSGSQSSIPFPPSHYMKYLSSWYCWCFYPVQFEFCFWNFFFREVLVYWSESEVAQSCPTPCNPMDCSLPGSSVYGIFQARVLEWVAISFSRRSSQPRDWSLVSHILGKCFTVWANRKVPSLLKACIYCVFLRFSRVYATSNCPFAGFFQVLQIILRFYCSASCLVLGLLLLEIRIWWQFLGPLACRLHQFSFLFTSTSSASCCYLMICAMFTHFPGPWGFLDTHFIEDITVIVFCLVGCQFFFLSFLFFSITLFFHYHMHCFYEGTWGD